MDMGIAAAVPHSHLAPHPVGWLRCVVRALSFEAGGDGGELRSRCYTHGATLVTMADVDVIADDTDLITLRGVLKRSP